MGLEYFLQAARAGDPSAMYFVAHTAIAALDASGALDDSGGIGGSGGDAGSIESGEGQGRPADHHLAAISGPEAVRLLERASGDLGHGGAAYYLGLLARAGHPGLGVEALGKPNLEEFRRLLLLAAEVNFKRARASHP